MPVGPTDPEPTTRPLRADAERNRQLILDAARSAFAEDGLGVRLDEIAAIAGVGVGTVYRRFEDKDELVAALFELELAKVVALADEALTVDGGTGLRWWLDHIVDAMLADRGLRQLLTGAYGSASPLPAMARKQLEPRVEELLQRAQGAGRARADIVTGDIPVIQVMLSSIIDATACIRPELALRYTQLVLDAIEPQADDVPLRATPPTLDEGVSVVEGWRPSPRRPGARS